MGEWMTTDEVATLFGVTSESVRTNFPRQFNLRPVDGLWDRREVLDRYLNRKGRGRPKKSA